MKSRSNVHSATWHSTRRTIWTNINTCTVYGACGRAIYAKCNSTMKTTTSTTSGFMLGFYPLNRIFRSMLTIKWRCLPIQAGVMAAVAVASMDIMPITPMDIMQQLQPRTVCRRRIPCKWSTLSAFRVNHNRKLCHLCCQTMPKNGRPTDWDAMNAIRHSPTVQHCSAISWSIRVSISNANNVKKHFIVKLNWKTMKKHTRKNRTENIRNAHASARAKPTQTSVHDQNKCTFWRELIHRNPLTYTKILFYFILFYCIFFFIYSLIKFNRLVKLLSLNW